VTELAVQTTAPQASTVAAYSPAVTPGSTVDLTSYWDRMGVAIQIAGPMCKTPFVPTAFRNKPEDTAMAIMYGLKYGMEPDAALSSIFLIGGRPGMYSRVQHALLLAHGHDVRIVKQTPEEVVVKGRRKGDEDGEWTESRWTIERARQAGYFTNEKYKTDPIAMLTARALGDCCRLVAPDLLMGIVAYNEADVEVMEVLDGDTLRPLQEKPAPVQVQRRVAAAPAPVQQARPFVNVAPAPAAPAEEPEPLSGPEADDSEALEEAEQQVEYDDGVMDADTVEEPSNVYQLNTGTPTAAPANETQIATMLAELNKAGHRTNPAKRKAVKEFIGRDVDGPHQMTADEADAFINHLMRQTTPTVDAAWGLNNTTEEN
jgi:hypothetical protein